MRERRNSLCPPSIRRALSDPSQMGVQAVRAGRGGGEIPKANETKAKQSRNLEMCVEREEQEEGCCGRYRSEVG